MKGTPMTLYNTDQHDVKGILDHFHIQLEKVKLTTSGNIQSLCPFHNEKSPSFFLFNNGGYYCHGCDKRGNIYQLVEHFTGLSRHEIDQSLSGANISYKTTSPKKDRPRRHLSEIEVEVLTLYSQGLHDQLAHSDRWNEYLKKKRGLSQNCINYFKLGAGGRVRGYNNYFLSHILNGHSHIEDPRSVLEGLHLYNRKSGDYFWSPCIIIPYQYSGQTFYLNARILPTYDTKIKYQNISGITRSYFFNEDVLDSHKSVYVVEGEFNAMSLWSHGIENVMSFGSKSSFNDDLISKLYGYDVTLYFDRDREDDPFRERQECIDKLLKLCKSVSYMELPTGTDLNDYLLTHSRQQFEDEVLSQVVKVDDPNEWTENEVRILSEDEKEISVSLGTAQQRNRSFMRSVNDNFRMFAGRKILVQSGIGTGKTTSLIEELLNKRKGQGKSLIFTSTHYLSNEYEENLDFDCFTCHLMSRTHTNCPYAHIAEYMSSRGYSMKFKYDYCYGKCEKLDDCMYLDIMRSAKDSGVLICVHAHSQIHDFMVNPYYDNPRRSLVVIDESAQLVRKVHFYKEVIENNKLLFQRVNDETLRKLVEILDDMEQARYSRQGYETPDLDLSTWNVYSMDKKISNVVNEDDIKKTQSMLYDLCYAIQDKRPFFYHERTDSLFYKWTPRFPETACIMFLSGTTTRSFLEDTLDIKIDRVVGDYNIIRENCHVIQLLGVTGGKRRVLSDDTTRNDLRESLYHILNRHRDHKIMIITSQGRNKTPEDEDDQSFKECVIDLLKPVSRQFNRTLIPVSTHDLETENVPQDRSVIPILHFGILGTNVFYDYDVVIEINSHYHNEDSIREGVLEHYGLDISQDIPVKKMIPFRTSDMEYQIEKYVHEDERVREYIRNKQESDVQQVEGRILRGEDDPKWIYRFHNTNVKPFPTKVYKSFDSFISGEFNVRRLSGRLDEIDQWIRDNVSIGETFTSTQLSESLNVDIKNLDTRYLVELEELGHIELKEIIRGRTGGKTWTRKL
jgi:hypothetical protein